MTTNWEDTFRTWMGAASDTEKEKREHAEKMVCDAIREDPRLSDRTLIVRAQGSYRNNTNVPQDSDVDIYVCCMDVCFPNYDFVDYGDEEAGLVNASYKYAEFKNDIDRALVAKFGPRSVTRGNKAIDIRANSYRVDADVVACFEHRRYKGHDFFGRTRYISGTEFIPDRGGSIINWPEQHYANGVKKNEATGRRFKGVTRILKELRYQMEEDGITAAKGGASFLIECLVWNTPGDRFGNKHVSDDVDRVLTYTYNGTKTDEACKEWVEVNDLKYCFAKVSRGPGSKPMHSSWPLGGMWASSRSHVDLHADSSCRYHRRLGVGAAATPRRNASAHRVPSTVLSGSRRGHDSPARVRPVALETVAVSLDG